MIFIIMYSKKQIFTQAFELIKSALQILKCLPQN